MHGPVGATNQLCLASSRAAMHAADDSSRRTGLGVLDERRRRARAVEEVVEDVCVKRTGEQPAVVTDRLRNQHENVRQFSPFYAHSANAATIGKPVWRESGASAKEYVW